jgi:phospholipid/cholesterol/gamma-HCH transport system permease protein
MGQMGNEMPILAEIEQHQARPDISPATLQQAGEEWALAGSWTARGLGDIPGRLDQLACGASNVVLNGEKLAALDSAGAWILQRWLSRQNAIPVFKKWSPQLQRLMDRVAERAKDPPTEPPQKLFLERVGRSATGNMQQVFALLSFVGETAAAAVRQLAHPGRIRWRILLRNIQIGGFDALPIIGLTSFLLGVVVAYQGADQLKNYGANIFVVDLVGYAMLREFAPLISAIIIAGRSGSAYTAEIGTMVITEEIDALLTIDIDPIDLLVLPKIAALVIALPLLTVFADITGVFGGMVMARSQLGVGFHEFIDRFGREMHGATLLVGIGKSVVFAIIISGIGCFQGFRTKGSADSVGRQTTMSVVQSIFLIIVADALFSVVFSMLDI